MTTDAATAIAIISSVAMTGLTALRFLVFFIFLFHLFFPLGIVVEPSQSSSILGKKKNGTFA